MEPEDEDIELLRRVQKRDAEAIRELVRKYKRRITNMLYAKFGLAFVSADLDDILAQIEWALYNGPHPEEGFFPTTVFYWLRRVAQHEAINLHRKRRKECPLDTDGVHQKTDQTVGPKEIERAVWLRELVDSYPKRARAAVAGLLLGKTIEELVRETGQSKSAIGRWHANFKKRFIGDAGDTKRNRDIVREGGNA